MGSPWAFHGGLLTSDSHSGGFSVTTASLPKPTCPRVEQWNGPKPQRACEAIYTVQSQHVSRNGKTIPVRLFGGTSPSSCKSVLGKCCLLFSRFLKYCTSSGQGRAGALRVPPFCPGFACFSSLSEDHWLENQRKHEHASEHGEKWGSLQHCAARGVGMDSFELHVFTPPFVLFPIAYL